MGFVPSSSFSSGFDWLGVGCLGVPGQHARLRVPPTHPLVVVMVVVMVVMVVKVGAEVVPHLVPLSLAGTEGEEGQADEHGEEPLGTV